VTNFLCWFENLLVYMCTNVFFYFTEISWYLHMLFLGFWNTVKFIGFSVIRVSQGSVFFMTNFKTRT